MPTLLVLINGLPASGKSTLARPLAGILGAQLLSKDTIKEALAACLDHPEAVPALGGIAMDMVWALAQSVPGPVVIDSWWFKPRDLLFAKAGIEKVRPNRAVEIWCDVPAETARARYATRSRATLHRDQHHLSTDWSTWAEHAAPLGLTPTVLIDTTQPVDCVDLADRINSCR